MLNFVILQYIYSIFRKILFFVKNYFFLYGWAISFGRLLVLVKNSLVTLVIFKRYFYLIRWLICKD